MSPYEPYQDPSEFEYPRAGTGYPGLNLSEERKEQVRKLDVPIDAITADDIVWNTSRNGTSYYFLLLREIAEQHGEAAAHQAAYRIGYVTGRSNYRKMQKRYGVTTLTPEMVAVYEDTVHLLSGVGFAPCQSEIRDREWVGRRPQCPFHTGAPASVGHYCRDVNRGFADAYRELDPEIEAVEYQTSLMDGDAECTHVIRYKEGGAERAR